MVFFDSMMIPHYRAEFHKGEKISKRGREKGWENVTENGVKGKNKVTILVKCQINETMKGAF
jgi:hypothetical protein